MTESASSHTPNVLSSNVSLSNGSVSNPNIPNADNMSVRAFYDIDAQEAGLSRPLSRGSMTSNLSMNTTRDGVEGSNNKRSGIPPYSLYLLSSMAHSQIRKSLEQSPSLNVSKNMTPDEMNDVRSVTSTPGYPDSPIYPPLSLREKMKLLNVDRNVPMIHPSTDSIDDTLLYQSNESTPVSIDDVLIHHHKYKPFPSINNNQTANLGDSGSCTLLETDLHINHPSMTNELDSIASTLGDDTSYLHSFRSIPPLVSPAESSEEL